MKNFKEMNEAEKKQYGQKLVEFTENGLKQLVATAEAWQKTEIKFFEDGLELLSAFGKFQEFVNQRRIFKDYHRVSLKSFQRYFEIVKKEVFGDGPIPTAAVERKKKSDKPVVVAPPAPIIGDNNNPPAPLPTVDEVCLNHGLRPSHFDQYRHLMPPHVQEFMDSYPLLVKRMVSERDMAVNMAEAGIADMDTIAVHVRKAHEAQAELHAGFNIIDQAWNQYLKEFYENEQNKSDEAPVLPRIIIPEIEVTPASEKFHELAYNLAENQIPIVSAEDAKSEGQTGNEAEEPAPVEEENPTPKAEEPAPGEEENPTPKARKKKGSKK